MLMLVGDRSRYQVVNFHYILSKLTTSGPKPKVLWCYKNELEFSTHQKKRIKEIKNMQMKGLYDENVDDPFELFVSSNEIRYSYYKESHKILGNTYQMLILQDFEALTPNLLCRTIETVEGGGLVIFLMKTMNSLKQLHSLTMDVHQRYRTDAFSEI
jgi:N-acetyltransferase 10